MALAIFIVVADNFFLRSYCRACQRYLGLRDGLSPADRLHNRKLKARNLAIVGGASVARVSALHDATERPFLPDHLDTRGSADDLFASGSQFNTNRSYHLRRLRCLQACQELHARRRSADRRPGLHVDGRLLHSSAACGHRSRLRLGSVAISSAQRRAFFRAARVSDCHL